MSKLSEKEILELINLADELNQKLFERFNDTLSDRFYFSTDGEDSMFGFNDKVLWTSLGDDRKFIEEENNYEPFKPFIINEFNNWLEEKYSYKL